MKTSGEKYFHSLYKERGLFPLRQRNQKANGAATI